MLTYHTELLLVIFLINLIIYYLHTRVRMLVSKVVIVFQDWRDTFFIFRQLHTNISIRIYFLTDFFKLLSFQIPKHLYVVKTDTFTQICLTLVLSLTSQYTSSSKQLSSAGSLHKGSLRIKPAILKDNNNYRSPQFYRSKLRIYIGLRH